MPNAVYAKKSLRISLWRSMYMLCYSEHCHTSFLMYQRCSQLCCLSKGVRNALTLCRLNKKHLYSTVTS